MVKVNEFWEVVCDKLEYKFFSGVACAGFDSLYKKMDPAKMHYVPAVDERTAIGIVTGTSFAGIKSALFTSLKGVHEFFPISSFLNEIKVPTVVFVYGVPESKKLLTQLGLPYVIMDADCVNFESALTAFEKKLANKKKPGLVLMDKGFIT